MSKIWLPASSVRNPKRRIGDSSSDAERKPGRRRHTQSLVRFGKKIKNLRYLEDLNSVPTKYILQPISSILVNFNNKVTGQLFSIPKLSSSLRFSLCVPFKRIPKLQEQDARNWWEAEVKMQNLLRKGAKLCYEKGYFSYEQMHNYFMSGTL